MKDYNNKLVNFQVVSANNGAGFLIRNGRTKEEVYLKSIRKERSRDLQMEYEFHMPNGNAPRRKKRKEKEEIQAMCAVSTWTADETQAMYFDTRKDAERMIESWDLLKHAHAEIIQG